MSKEGEDIQKPATCSFCEASFPSKTKLFRHLVESHGFESKDKPFKVVVLLGWMSHVKNDNDIWLNDHSSIDPSEVDVTSVQVENAFFAAYNQLAYQDLPSPCYDRPKGYSRGTGIAQRTSLLYSSEPTCHSLCDTLCFQLKSWGNHYEGGKEGWVRRMNELLPPTIRILQAYMLSSAAGSNFHAEMDCSQRRYEYLIPLSAVMPPHIVKPPEIAVTRRNKHRVEDHTSMDMDDACLMDKSFPIDTIEGQTRVAYFRKLKDIFKRIGGIHRKKFHNFTTAGAETIDNNITHRIDRIFHKEIFAVDGENWVVFSVSGDTVLRGGVRKILGLAFAVALGFLPVEYIDVALDATRVVELPSLPGFPLYIAECRYCLWEAKYTDYRLDPRRTDIGMTPAMIEWNSAIHRHIIKNSKDVFPTNWINSFQQSCEAIYSRFLKIDILLNRSLLQLQNEFEDKFNFSFALEQRNDTVPSAESKEMKIDVDDDTALEKENKEKVIVNARTENMEEFAQRVVELKFLKVPVEKDDVPSVYSEVLTLLRQADRSKAWPASSTGRQLVIDSPTLLENGGRGGSFSVGALPAPLPQPKGNIYFPGNASRPFSFRFI